MSLAINALYEWDRGNEDWTEENVVEEAEAADFGTVVEVPALSSTILQMPKGYAISWMPRLTGRTTSRYRGRGICWSKVMASYGSVDDAQCTRTILPR